MQSPITIATSTWKEDSVTRMLMVPKKAGDKHWVLNGRLGETHWPWLSAYVNARLTKYT